MRPGKRVFAFALIWWSGGLLLFPPNFLFTELQNWINWWFYSPFIWAVGEFLWFIFKPDIWRLPNRSQNGTRKVRLLPPED